MEGLKEAIDERVSFLKEQINPDERKIFNASFQAQIEILRNADPEKVALYLLQKKKQLENCKDLNQFEILYSEIEALEWLQREVVRRIK